jgi:hypothetical protein
MDPRFPLPVTTEAPWSRVLVVVIAPKVVTEPRHAHLLRRPRHASHEPLRMLSGAIARHVDPERFALRGR